jgi:FdhE protein
MTGAAGRGRAATADELPELARWRRLYEDVRGGLADPAPSGWVSVTPAAGPPGDGVPQLADAAIAVDLRRAAAWIRGLVDRAAPGSGPAATLRAGHLTERPLLALLGASVAEDRARLDALARELEAEPGALAALAALAVMPLLHACRRALAARVPADWIHGHCPICGAWPTLAEARGVERSRHHRCARCGAAWFAGWLRCPYCGTSDHQRVGALVGEEPGARDRVETCEVCRGYVKTLTVLLPIEADRIALADLDSLDLDLAALLHGYRRPPAPGRLGSLRVEAGRAS